MNASTLIPVKCPKCDSQTIVEYKPHVYHCLKCDFERDLNDPAQAEQKSGGMTVVLSILGFALAMVMLL